MISISGEQRRLGVALRLSVTPARFGRREVRFGSRSRSFEIAPLAGACPVATAGGAVVGELAFSILGDYPKDAQVRVAQDGSPPRTGTGSEAATASGNLSVGASAVTSLNPRRLSAPAID